MTGREGKRRKKEEEKEDMKTYRVSYACTVCFTPSGKRLRGKMYRDETCAPPRALRAGAGKEGIKEQLSLALARGQPVALIPWRR